MKKLTLLTGLFLLSIAQVFAQAYQGRQDNYWSLGFQVNSMNYFGDLNPKNQYLSTHVGHSRPGVFLHAAKRLGTNFRVRASLGYGRIVGNDFDASGNFEKMSGEVQLKKMARYGRNLHFRNDIKELAVTATYDFKKSLGRYYRRAPVAPYLMLGIGVFHHSPQAIAPEGTAEAGKWINLQPLGTEGQGRDGYAKKYGLIQASILSGAGVRFRATDRIDIGFEIGIRTTFFNYLDDVGGDYADIKDMLDNPTAIRMADRSAERYDAMTGKERNLLAIAPSIGTVTYNYGGQAPTPRIAGQGVPSEYQRLSSYGLKGDKRGLKGSMHNDIYVATGFHLYYILSQKRQPRFEGF